MLERVFECGSALAPATSLDRRLAQEVPCLRHPGVVAKCLESRNRLLSDPCDLLRGRLRVREDPEERALYQRAQFELAVAVGTCEAEGFLERTLCGCERAGPHESNRELEERVASRAARPRQQRDPTLEQVDRGRRVVARQRLPAGGRE